MVYSIFKQLKYISFLAACFGFLQNHLQANINHREVPSVCTYIMASHRVHRA